MVTGVSILPPFVPSSNVISNSTLTLAFFIVPLHIGHCIRSKFIHKIIGIRIINVCPASLQSRLCPDKFTEPDDILDAFRLTCLDYEFPRNTV